MLIDFTKLLFYQMARKAPRIIFNHVARIRSYHRRIALRYHFASAICLSAPPNFKCAEHWYTIEAYHAIPNTIIGLVCSLPDSRYRMPFNPSVGMFRDI